MSMSRKQFSHEIYSSEPSDWDIYQDGLYIPPERARPLPSKKVFDRVLAEILAKFDKNKSLGDNLVNGKSFPNTKGNE